MVWVDIRHMERSFGWNGFGNLIFWGLKVVLLCTCPVLGAVLGLYPKSLAKNVFRILFFWDIMQI